MKQTTGMTLERKQQIASESQDSSMKRRKAKVMHGTLKSLKVTALPLRIYDQQNMKYYTQYRVSISCENNGGVWAILKRYSDFRSFRKTIKAFVKNNKFLDSQTVIQFSSILSKGFPKRHFRVDDFKIIAERCHYLEKFVEDLVCILLVPLEDKTNASAELHSLVQNFIEYPESQVFHQNILSSIKDVDMSSFCHLDEECCICLESWKVTSQVTVNLPCKHTFHEDCILEWFSKNINCPICRN